MGIFNSIRTALSSGSRSGKAVKVIEDVLGRSLSSDERENVREFGLNQNYSESTDEYDEADNYLYGLLYGFGNEVQKVKPEVGDWILDCMVRAAKEGRYVNKNYKGKQDSFIISLEKYRDEYRMTRGTR
jgi:hypothetical protein